MSLLDSTGKLIDRYKPLSDSLESLKTRVEALESGSTTSGSYYFTPEEITGYYKPTAQDYAKFSHYHATTSVLDVYSAFNELMSDHPDYISSHTYGNDESDTYPIKEYSFTPDLTEVSPLDSEKSLPKLLIITGLHGDEKMSIFSLYHLVYDICENWRDNEVLKYLRWNVEIKLMPITNPWGFHAGGQGRRTNANEVDLNRDFDDFTQVETQYIKDFIDNNTDAIYFGDYHTNGTSGNEYGTLMWHSNLSGTHNSETIDISSKYTISLLSREFVDEYLLPDDVGFFGYVTHNNVSGMSKHYGARQGISSNTFECFRKFPEQEGFFNETALKACTEYVGNWLGSILKKFKQKN